MTPVLPWKVVKEVKEENSPIAETVISPKHFLFRPRHMARL